MLKKEKYLEILMKNISSLVDMEKFFMDIFFQQFLQLFPIHTQIF